MVQKSIGIIGGNGFIGSNILPELNCDKVERNSDGKYYNVLINANGNSSKILADQDVIANFNANVNSTLDTLLRFKFGIYIHISSCEVYEDISSYDKTDEDYPIDVAKLSNYGLSKYFSECLVKNYCKRWIILRLNGPVSKNAKKGPIYDIMYGDKLWISQESEFQFIHMSSVSDFIKHIIEKDITNEIFNVTSNNTLKIKTAMKMLTREVPFPEEPVIKHRINVDKFSKFGYITSAKESIRRLID